MHKELLGTKRRFRRAKHRFRRPIYPTPWEKPATLRAIGVAPAVGWFNAMRTETLTDKTKNLLR